MKDKTLVTAALPYANGKPHVGHIAGAYLPADTYVRFLRLMGKDAVFVCGSDENGAPITFSAIKEGVTPQDIVDRYHAVLSESFKGLGIDFDYYGRTHCEKHNGISQEFFTTLHDKGHVVKRSSEQVYCTECNMFLPDRYIEGNCPHPDCKKPGARGDQCESCGRPVDATKLEDPVCMVCKQSGREGKGCIEVRETTHWYLRLDAFEKDLRAYLDLHPEWRESVKRFSYGLLDQGLRERCVTRDLDWGIPVPLEEAEGKVLYVWFDAPIGYITFTRQYLESLGKEEEWKDYWYNQDNGLVHFIGKDNTVFHAVMFPGMMMAHGDYRMPDTVVSNEFLNLEGDKISTSRNYAVWVNEYLEAFSPDPLRYYLTAIAPENSDSDFSWQGFQNRNNGELADNLGNFIQRNLAFCNKYFEGKVPPAENISDAGKELLEEIEKTRTELAELFDGHRYRDALERIMLLSRKGNEFFSAEEPWKSRKDDMAKCGATIYTCMMVIEALSVFMSPILPFSAAKLRECLNIPALSAGDWNTDAVLKSGHTINTPEVLFPKIDDAMIEEQVAKLTPKAKAE